MDFRTAETTPEKSLDTKVTCMETTYLVVLLILARTTRSQERDTYFTRAALYTTNWSTNT